MFLIQFQLFLYTTGDIFLPCVVLVLFLPEFTWALVNPTECGSFPVASCPPWQSPGAVPRRTRGPTSCRQVAREAWPSCVPTHLPPALAQPAETRLLPALPRPSSPLLLTETSRVPCQCMLVPALPRHLPHPHSCLPCGSPHSSVAPQCPPSRCLLPALPGKVSFPEPAPGPGPSPPIRSARRPSPLFPKHTAPLVPGLSCPLRYSPTFGVVAATVFASLWLP